MQRLGLMSRQCVKAKARAGARAREPRCPRVAPLLATIIAESYAREGKHSAARSC